MWSKTRKALMDRMADSLKKRVRYNFEVYTTKKCRWWSETPAFYIHVDDELWFATNPQYYWKQTEYLSKNVDRSLPCHEYWEAMPGLGQMLMIIHPNTALWMHII